MVWKGSFSSRAQSDKTKRSLDLEGDPVSWAHLVRYVYYNYMYILLIVTLLHVHMRINLRCLSEKGTNAPSFHHCSLLVWVCPRYLAHHNYSAHLKMTPFHDEQHAHGIPVMYPNKYIID